MKIPSKLALAALTALAAGCAGGGSPEKVTLRVGAPVGVSYVFERKESLEGSLVIRADGKESRQSIGKEDRRLVQDEVLESEGGKVQRLRRKVLEWTFRRQGPGDAGLMPVPRTMVGKTIVLRRTELGTEYEGAEGIPAEELRAHPIDAIEAILSLPAEPVSAGAAWEVDGDRIVEVFGGDGQGGLKVREAKGTGHLDRLEDGGRTAVIAMKIQADGAFRQLLDVDVTLELAGTFRLDVATGRVLSFKAAGTGKISGEVNRAGKPAIYDGSFKVAVEGQTR